MKIKGLLFKVIRFSGIVFIIREFVQRGKVTIIMYHDVPKNIAERNFEYLSKNYNVIELNDLVKWLDSSGKTKLPKKSMIITFDDGHVGNYDLLKVFKKYKTPVTVFLCSHIIDTNRHFWFNYKHPDLKVEELKKVDNKERLRQLSKLGFSNEYEYAKAQAISRHQLEEMSEIVDFQAHTMFHPCLPQCDNEDLHEELHESKKLLTEKFNLEIKSIAYPNGDYDERTIEYALKAGYKIGLTCQNGYNSRKTNKFKLNRFSTNDTHNQDEFILRASGIYGYSNNLIKKIFKK